MTEARIPPHSIPAEQSILGTLLVDPRAWNKVAPDLQADRLYLHSHREIYMAMSGLAAEGAPLDIVTVAERMERLGTLADAGGLAYLGQLVLGTNSTAHVEHHVRLVVELAALRALIQAGQEIGDAVHGRGTAEDVIALAQNRIDQATEVAAKASRWKSQSLDALLPAVLEGLERKLAESELPGVQSGLRRLDHKTGGFQRGDLAILAARPAQGKTALAVNFALAAGHRVGFISAEQPAGQIVQRMLALLGDVHAWKLRNPRALSQDEWKRIAAAAKSLQTFPVEIYDAPAPSLATVRAQAERMRPEILFVDYMQRLKAPGIGIYDRVSRIAQGLKELARTLDIPVVALSQINRQGTRNAGMEHLKGSGDIEQEADLVLILEREEGSDTVANLMLEKNRHGPTGAVRLYFDAPVMRFSELEEAK